MMPSCRSPHPQAGAMLLPLAAIVMAYALAGTYKEAQRHWGGDYLTFRVGAHALEAGHAVRIYDRDQWPLLLQEYCDHLEAQGNSPRILSHARKREKSHLTGTPLFYAAIAAGSSANHEADLKRHRAMLLTAGAGAVALLAWSMGWSLTATMLAVAAVYSSGFAPAFLDLGVGNVNSIQLLGLALVVVVQSRFTPWPRCRDVLTGLLLVGLLLYKPNFGPMAVVLTAYWLVSRRWGTLLWATVGGAFAAALALVVTWMTFGTWRCWIDWLAVLRWLTEGHRSIDLGNHGLSPMILIRTGHDLSRWLMLLTLGLACLAIWLGRPGREPSAAPTGDAAATAHRLALVLGLGAGVLLLSNRIAWIHYHLLLTPLLPALLSPGLLELSRGRRVVWLSLAATAVVCVGGVPLARELGLHEANRAAAVRILGVLLASALAWLALANRRHRTT